MAKIICRNCKTEIDEGLELCPNCGFIPVSKCPKCGNILNNGKCTSCNYNLQNNSLDSKIIKNRLLFFIIAAIVILIIIFIKNIITRPKNMDELIESGKYSIYYKFAQNLYNTNSQCVSSDYNITNCKREVIFNEKYIDFIIIEDDDTRYVLNVKATYDDYYKITNYELKYEYDNKYYYYDYKSNEEYIYDIKNSCYSVINSDENYELCGNGTEKELVKLKKHFDKSFEKYNVNKTDIQKYIEKLYEETIEEFNNARGN